VELVCYNESSVCFHRRELTELQGPKFTICVASVNGIIYVIHKITLFLKILFISNLRKT